jgi:PAS domain S-box-containing protein
MISGTRDTTEPECVECILKKSEEEYHSILDANPEPVILYDMEGKVEYFNLAFTNVFGWTLDECFGKSMDFFVLEDVWPGTKTMIDNLLSGDNFSGVETRCFTKDGSIIHASLSGAIYRNMNGDPIGSIVTIRDISEQKKLEKQAQQAAIGILAGGIAHNFNNLLMAIQGRTSLMLFDTNHDHPHFKHLKGIEDYIDRAAILTKQLLGFARGGKYQVKPSDVKEIIHTSFDMFRRTKNKVAIHIYIQEEIIHTSFDVFGRTKNEIAIHIYIQRDIWSVEVEQSQIEQALLNLYVNAWQAMPGGGDLYIQAQNTVIDENFRRSYQTVPGKYVQISVTDTGRGMDRATRQRIFDPFFTTMEMGEGVGLGLASVYGIIKNHGGFIDVYSKKGKGTTFEIYLPASRKVPVKEKNAHKEVSRGTEKILFVDDEEMIIEVGRAIIENLGYQVLIARSGQEAIEIYTKNREKIDMVILDIIMPVMAGDSIYDKLKEINPDIKVLLSSGGGIDCKVSDLLNCGCDGFIQKPFNMGVLSNKIREILDK